MAQSNREVLLACMIEDMEAVERIDEIAAVEGVDLLAVGPSDLSRSLGVSGQPDHPRLVAAIDRVREAVKKGAGARLALPLNHAAFPRNAVQLEDGSWVWRHARHRAAEPPRQEGDVADRFGPLWDIVSSLDVSLLLVRGMRPQSVVRDEHEEELLRRLPSAQVAHVENAGHSVQGDDPLELARLVAAFVP